jgi:hypothetical protein
LLTGDSGPVSGALCSDAHLRVVNKPVKAKDFFGVLRSLLI